MRDVCGRTPARSTCDRLDKRWGAVEWAMVPKRNSEPAVTRAKYQNPLLADEGRVALPRLHVAIERRAGEEETSTYVHDGDVCRIGSHASNDLVLSDPTVSRFHCRITREVAGWRITDTGSRNGTRLDGVRVLVAELESEAVIAIGESMLRVRTADLGAVSVPVVRSFGALVGRSVAMQQLYAVLERIAASEIDVLIHGESGTGKELVATELVQRSARADGPLVVVDCGSISPSLVESELFGHVRGAFTGAERDRQGAFEAANGGTIFLDEIGELPAEVQPKLLRALEAREVRRVGQTRPTRIDVRVIAATHRDLEREVNRGSFREDLYYRLAKVGVRVPPLRDRADDIPLIVESLLASLDARESAHLFSPAVLAEMQRHEWPGNVRELRNYVERSIVLAETPSPSHRSGTRTAFKVPSSSLEAEALARADLSVPFRIAKESIVRIFERAYLGPLIEQCQGNMSKAARVARMDRMYLHQLAQKYGFHQGRSTDGND
jgi:DNA-binding NtrC family response regulator